MSPTIPTIPTSPRPSITSGRRSEGDAQARPPQSSDRNPHRDRRARACHGRRFRRLPLEPDEILHRQRRRRGGRVPRREHQRVRPGAVARGQAHEHRHRLAAAGVARPADGITFNSYDEAIQHVQVVRSGEKQLQRQFLPTRPSRPATRATARPSSSDSSDSSGSTARTHRPPAQTAVTPNDPHTSPSGVAAAVRHADQRRRLLPECSCASTATSPPTTSACWPWSARCSSCCGDCCCGSSRTPAR